MAKQFVGAAAKETVAVSAADLSALVTVLETVTREIDKLKVEVAGIKLATNREIVRARHGDAVVNTAGDSQAIMQQLATAPVTHSSIPPYPGSEPRGYVPGAN